MYKTRFCPSPTGLMHLGNLRTALFNVLLAKSFRKTDPDTRFLLRIEDTDKQRSEVVFSEKLMGDLKWLDLNWQEGPFYQSQREDLYEDYYQKLIKAGRAYWCYCSDAELTITRRAQIQAGQPPRYPNTCRHLTPEQAEAKKAKGVIPALRFHMPDNEIVFFEDFIQGERRFSSDDIGDFIIKKADGSSSFMFCNAIDDALMDVTHVMRGDDHLTNTPRQLLVLKYLGLKAPQYGHMPLILGFDGKPLSKRNGSQSVEHMRDSGYFPLAIINYLSRLGHHFESDKLGTLDELGELFNIKQIGHSPARFDLTQLNHWQKETILKMDDKAIWEWMSPHIDEVPADKISDFTHTIKENVILPHEAKDWAKRIFILLDEQEPDFYEPQAMTFLQELKRNLNEQKPILTEIRRVLNQCADGAMDYDQFIGQIEQETKKKGKKFYLLVRITMTGRTDGPKLVNLFKLIDKAFMLHRLNALEAQLEEL